MNLFEFKCIFLLANLQKLAAISKDTFNSKASHTFVNLFLAFDIRFF